MSETGGPAHAPPPTHRKATRGRAVAVTGLLVLFAGDCRIGGLGGNTFLVRNVRIFDGRHVIDRGAVLVRHGRIARVGPDEPDELDLPVHDGEGKTLLPGLIDSHVHLFSANARRDALRFGVTTVLEMFGDPSRLGDARRERESQGAVGQADVWSAGIGVTVPGGHPVSGDFPRLAAGESVDRFAADRIHEGSDFIKLVLEDGDLPPLPTLDPSQARGVVMAAHQRGRMAVAHAEKLALARIALGAGSDGLAHTIFDTDVDNELIKAAQERKVFVVSTLTVVDCGASARQLLGDAGMTHLMSADQKESLQRWKARCPPNAHATGEANVRRLHDAGLTVLAGTDAGLPGTAHGLSLLTELEYLVGAGLTPVQALATATELPAREFGLSDRGRISPGLRADLLLVHGDPTRDVSLIRHIAHIWKNGYPVDRAP